jgi:hypothetical protein
MPRVNFDALPTHGRLWVFPSSRQLSEGEVDVLLEAVDAFLDGWAAHGAPLRSGREVTAGRFLLVGVDEDAEAPSGCSIDALVNRLRALGSEMGADLVDHEPVFYRDGRVVRSASRAEFRAMVAAGEVGPETRVFDTTLTRIRDLRERGLERPVRESWHAKAFLKERAAR